jgi:transcriptional regulator with XRE-family HTH domain
MGAEAGTGTELGLFLQAKRSKLKPYDVGLADGGKQRRVSGLRREEVAMLAQVSVNYYTRLEQGQNRSASLEVLNALAVALRLTADERAHLHNLAGLGVNRHPDERSDSQVRMGVAEMVASYTAGPAIVLGRRTEILAWNDLAEGVFSSYIQLPEPGSRTELLNLAELVFLHPGARRLYPSWTDEAQETAGYLRIMAGRYPHDAALAALIDHLSERSGEFADMWAAHIIWDKSHGTRHIYHPATGPLSLLYESFRLPDSPGQCLILYRAKPGSADETALNVLRKAVDKP